MNKMHITKLLSLLLVMLLVFPTLASAAVEEKVTIKSVYFQSEDGKMVFVNYEEAIQQSLAKSNILYDAIKRYVGIAETKGRPLYLETNTGKILDYGKAMADNLFILKDIIGIEKYEIKQKIEFSHELKVVKGNAVIVEKGEVQNPDLVELVSIAKANDITVDFGTKKQKAIKALQSTTTIEDSKGTTHTVKLKWTISNYKGDIAETYEAIGNFELPKGISNSAELELKVKALVVVKAKEQEPEPEPELDFPIEVKDVVIGTSQITNNTYANIEIKVEYTELMEAVYLNGELAHNIEGQPSQWRIIIADGTTLEGLKGKISVLAGGEKDVVETKFNKDSLLGEGFGLGRFMVSISSPKEYKDITQYAVKYTVGSSDTTVTTSMVELGSSPKELVQNIEGVNILTIILYNDNGVEVATIVNVMNK